MTQKLLLVFTKHALAIENCSQEDCRLLRMKSFSRVTSKSLLELPTVPETQKCPEFRITAKTLMVAATNSILVGPDEEAVVDLGKTSSTVNTKFEKEELESHRAVYIGVHVPFGKESRRRHKHRGHKHHHRRRKDKESDKEDGRESPSYDTPSQRVQFILGTEDDDEQHIPHDLFTEMDELCYRDGEDYEWKETARWLKFEEDVEDGGDRWSKPYVATLSLHSLFELRSCILNGTVMLDMRASTLDEIADMVLDNMIASGQLDESIRENVREALLKRHHHQNEKRFTSRIPLVRSFADIGKKHSDPLLLERNGILASPQSAPGNLDISKSGEIKGNGSGGSRENSTVDFSKVDMNFMRKIPTGAEASNVLVGEVDFLERPIIAFVRLAPAVLLSGLTEVPVPTRFLFLLLGPAGKAPQYHEIGRSIATLMTDEIFHDVAYKAKDRNDLLSGIDEFLDQVTVLPPGEWDPSIRIEPPKSVPSQVRSTISDFAVFLTIVIMVAIDYLVGVPSPKLHVPEKFEVLALVFVRKLMDLCFTKRELSWLDDLMPESKKKKEDDKKKKEKEEAERMLQEDDDTVHLPFEGRSLLQIPVKALKYSVDPSVVNISDEMAKTAQWKALSMNTENAKVTRSNTSPEKPMSVTINFEDEPSKKYMDAETSL
ncbi:Sodium bicarbonate cotransporter 3 [Fukomys damarensis]|uniref:Sodium bicarbonate cotransporter 3 n=1 Tax=Fukomys damarensis TaxID=885580 RepID=A0A091D8A4_FUKDA|nr:Sodium bicarbonate cotransporter 3 [Fukomys damarensis]